MWTSYVRVTTICRDLTTIWPEAQHDQQVPHDVGVSVLPSPFRQPRRRRHKRPSHPSRGCLWHPLPAQETPTSHRGCGWWRSKVAGSGILHLGIVLGGSLSQRVNRGIRAASCPALGSHHRWRHRAARDHDVGKPVKKAPGVLLSMSLAASILLSALRRRDQAHRISLEHDQSIAHDHLSANPLGLPQRHRNPGH